MEDEFIAEAANDVTAAFHDYLRPLLGSDMPEVVAARGQGREGLEPHSSF